MLKAGEGHGVKVEPSCLVEGRKDLATNFLIKCYGTNSGAPSDGRHLAPGRPAGPRDETLPSIVLMVLMV
jgi:hypothetical protein